MDEKLEQLLEWLVQVAKKSQDFILEQAPPLAREIITYGRVSTSVTVGLILGILILCTFLTVKYSTKWCDWMSKNECPHIGILAWIGILVSTPLFFKHLNPLIKVWFAPRLYLLETVTRMLS